MKWKRFFLVSYIPPTDTKGSRVKIEDLRHEKTKIIAYDHSCANIQDVAKKFLEGLEISVDVMGCYGQKILIGTDNYPITF